VGHKPGSISFVRRPGVGSSQHPPFCRVPHLGKITEHSIESSNNEHWAVLNECVARSYLANNPCHFSPQPGAGAFEAGTFSGNADVLARKAARYHINNASPRFSVEGSHIVPHGEGFKASVILSGEQYTPGVFVNLNGADCPPSEHFASENAASSACEKCQLIQRNLRLQIRTSSIIAFSPRIAKL
jgi:ribosomal protein L36